MGISLAAHPHGYFQEVTVLIVLFVPDQQVGNIGVALQQSFIALSEQEIDLRIGIVVVQGLNKGSCQYDIPGESGLYD